jgi:hypothetical protein
LLSPVQDTLLNGRVLAQALYRQATQQLPPAPTPTVVVVQIDEPSIRRAGISNPNPIDRAYLARLIARLSHLRARVIGVDYLLDRQQPGKDAILAQTLRQTLAKDPTWLVFAALPANQGGEIGVAPETGIADPRWSLQGDVTALPQYLKLLPPGGDCRRSCPFAYLVAVVQQFRQDPLKPSLQPNLQSATDLRTQLFNYAEALSANHPHPQETHHNQLAQLAQLRVTPITAISEQVGQLWLRPINDFSIPPTFAYQRLSAWQVLAEENTALRQLSKHFPEQVIIISSGGYYEAGVEQPGADNFPVPWAVAFWRAFLATETDPEKTVSHAQNFSGAEAKAYMISSLLRRGWITPIPDFWLVLLAAGFGKATTLWLAQSTNPAKTRWRWVSLAPLGYGILGLQIYISAAVLLPWFLPAITFWSYLFSIFPAPKSTHAKP